MSTNSLAKSNSMSALKLGLGRHAHDVNPDNVHQIGIVCPRLLSPASDKLIISRPKGGLASSDNLDLDLAVNLSCDTSPIPSAVPPHMAAQGKLHRCWFDSRLVGVAVMRPNLPMLASPVFLEQKASGRALLRPK